MAQWAHQESKDPVEREEIREKREAMVPAAEMVSLAPPETPAPLDLQDLMDPLALVETLLLRWLVVSTRRLAARRWV